MLMNTYSVRKAAQAEFIAKQTNKQTSIADCAHDLFKSPWLAKDMTNVYPTNDTRVPISMLPLFTASPPTMYKTVKPV